MDGLIDFLGRPLNNGDSVVCLRNETLVAGVVLRPYAATSNNGRIRLWAIVQIEGRELILAPENLVAGFPARSNTCER